MAALPHVQRPQKTLLFFAFFSLRKDIIPFSSVASNYALDNYNPTKILVIAVDTFDEILEEDQEFSRRILELETSRLKQIIT